MNRVRELRELHAFHRWANGLLLDAVAALPAGDFVRHLGSSFPSIRDTLVHAMSAEWVWLERWNGVSPDALPDGWAESGLAELKERWSGVQGGLARRLGALTEPELDRVIEYRDLSGRSHRSAVGQILRHVVNHGSYHRGQVVTMLRQLGAAAPSTDLIRYYREVAPGAAVRT